MNLRRKSVRMVTATLIASTSFGIVGVLANASNSHADPAYAAGGANSPRVGVGSDTIQAVFDAYTGAEPYPPAANTVHYIPMVNPATGVGVASFDAIPAGGSATAPGCITPKPGGTTFDRPNGSGNGIAALNDTLSGTAWLASTASCTGVGVSVTGQIDFARSSSGVTTTGTTLTWIPFARDAVSVAYFDHSTNNLASLTGAQLTNLYSSATGSITVGTDTVLACLPQSGSGTRKFFEKAIGVTDTVAAAAVTASGCSATEENGANTFYTYASGLPAGTDAVIPFSVGSWISQANGAATDASATGRANGVDLANLDALGKPYTGTPGTEAAVTAFYSSTTWGRNVYVVVLTRALGTALGKDTTLQALFSGSTAQICNTTSQATANKFGFDSLTAAEGTCGATTLQGAN